MPALQIGVNIGFQESSYIASESDESVTVCTVISGLTEGGLAQDLLISLAISGEASAGLLFVQYYNRFIHVLL